MSAEREILAGGVPASLFERINSDYLFLVYQGLSGQPRLNATLISEMDSIVEAPNSQRAERLRDFIATLNQQTKSGGGEAAGADNDVYL